MRRRHDYTKAKRAVRTWYSIRCRKCGAREVLKWRALEDDWFCRRCPSTSFRTDWYRTAKIESRKNKCRCGAYEWPHNGRTCFNAKPTQRNALRNNDLGAIA